MGEREGEQEGGKERKSERIKFRGTVYNAGTNSGKPGDVAILKDNYLYDIGGAAGVRFYVRFVFFFS